MKNRIKKIEFIIILMFFHSFIFSQSNIKKVIIIDAAHGGTDFGAMISESSEKIIVDSIASKIKKLNKSNDIEIILLRKGDCYIDLNERVNIINKITPSLLISLHVNASKDKDKNGIMAYISRKNEYYETSLENAQKLLIKVSSEELASEGIEERNFYVIQNSRCPSILLEIGYLSNKKNHNYIISENGQNEIAYKIFQFINEI